MKNYQSILLILIFFCSFSGAESLEKELKKCSGITAPMKRLYCFDKVSGTPINRVKQTEISPSLPPISLLYNDEKIGTKIDSFSFLERLNSIKLITKSTDNSDYEPLLFLGCLDNITRLQIAIKKPLLGTERIVKIRNKATGKVLSSQTWQILENGSLLDIGRGLFAITQIKRILKADNIIVEVQSKKKTWEFNIKNLPKHITKLRNSCKW